MSARPCPPVQTRFLHNPWQPHGFVGAALSSNVIHFTKVCCAVLCCAVLCCAVLWGAREALQQMASKEVDEFTACSSSAVHSRLRFWCRAALNRPQGMTYFPSLFAVQGSNGNSDKWVHDVAIKQVTTAGLLKMPRRTVCCYQPAAAARVSHSHCHCLQVNARR